MAHQDEIAIRILKVFVVILGLIFVIVVGWGVYVLLSTTFTPQPLAGTIVSAPATLGLGPTVNPSITPPTRDPALHATFMAEKYPEPGSPAFQTRTAAIAPYQNSSAYKFDVSIWLEVAGVILALLIAASLLLRDRVRKKKDSIGEKHDSSS
jgi:ABC-type antimicrobial peptide transport system permease subunit